MYTKEKPRKKKTKAKLKAKTNKLTKMKKTCIINSRLVIYSVSCKTLKV